MTPGFDAAAFESLGGNCEFGFVLSRCGQEEATAFRWTEIDDPSELVRAIDCDLHGMFEYENIAPCNEGMVLDRAFNIAWHSHVRSEVIDRGKLALPDNYRFVTPEDRRRTLLEDQKKKVAHLCERTREHMRLNSRIFVYRPLRRNKGFGVDSAVRILEALERKGAEKLLVVTEAGPTDTPGTVERVCRGLLHGRIDRFAPGSNAKAFSFDIWVLLCSKAQAMSAQTAETLYAGTHA
jgi:hypothetical protein